jgi:dTDP-4-dehydrorhamnose reductase
MACEGHTSRLEVAIEMINLLNLQDKVTITAVSSDYFTKTYFAERPPSERLENRKLRIRGLNGMRDWPVALRDYLENYYYGR